MLFLNNLNTLSKQRAYAKIIQKWKCLISGNKLNCVTRCRNSKISSLGRPLRHFLGKLVIVRCNFRCSLTRNQYLVMEKGEIPTLSVCFFHFFLSFAPSIRFISPLMYIFCLQAFHQILTTTEDLIIVWEVLASTAHVAFLAETRIYWRLLRRARSKILAYHSM